MNNEEGLSRGHEYDGTPLLSIHVMAHPTRLRFRFEQRVER
ncbi:hypothetical protein [Paenibacillus pabuli]|nr:hypothetical protein [Paenibacillus pabuli]